MAAIYMDNNATTPVLPEVVAAMQPYWFDRFGNASAVHSHGRTAREAIDTAREQVAALIGARATEITFTGSGTESDNHALFGTLSPGQHLITSSIEHHAVLHAAHELERRGTELTIIDPDRNGIVQADAIREAIRPNTALISLMLANNETGVLQPVREIAALLRHLRETGSLPPSQSILVHTDAVQCGGKIPINVRDLGCDLLSLSAHKMHAPQGVGALWSRRGLKVRPLLYGGPHERQRRAGTENVPGIVAFGAAAALARTWLTQSSESSGCAPCPSRDTGSQSEDRSPESTTEHIRPSSEGTGLSQAIHASETARLQPQGETPFISPASLHALHQHLETELLCRIPTTTIHGYEVPRLPNTTSVRFAGIDAEALVIALDLKGLSISGGSPCTSGAVEPSHVLRAMGLTDAEARSTVRISLSRLTTEAEVEAALTLLTNTVAHLRTLA